jgi:fimbrial chaperone protein|tara:strand:+ start:2366 stop:3079 length:714 start_codon:yes stop_codon:yes gene_type:complete
VSKVIFFIALFSSLSANAFSVSGSRFIVTDDTSRTPVTITNSLETDIVVQSWLDDYIVESFTSSAKAAEYKSNGKGLTLAPGFFKVKANNSYTYYLQKLDSLTLPNDRESIVGLYIRGLPNESSGDDSIVYLVQQLILKVFYRPSGIKEKRFGADSQLIPTCVQGKLHLNNPTPFIFSPVNVWSDQQLYPYSSLITHGLNLIEGVSCKGLVTIETVNDFGGQNKYDLGQPLIGADDS